MQIQFLKSPTASPYLLAYNAGDIADIEDAIAKDLILQQIATPTTPKPSDLSEKATSKQAARAEKR